MTSDQDESRSVWQRSNAAAGWEPSFEVLDSSPAQQVSDSSDPLAGQTTGDIDAYEADEFADDADGWTEPEAGRFESLQQFGRQFSPVLVPLPFALLIFIFTLPFTLKGPPAYPSILIMSILLFAVALFQGTLLYLAGDNDGLWMLYIGLGYGLFLACGAFAIWGFMGAAFTLGLLLLIGLVLAQRGLRPTPEGHVDIIESFGKYSNTLHPGLNFLMPWEKLFVRLSTQATTWSSDFQDVPISQEQYVHFRATISYQLMPEDAYFAAMQVKNWELSLQELFIGVTQSVMSELSPADLVAWSHSMYGRQGNNQHLADVSAPTRWDRINASIARRVQDKVALWGVQVNWVSIHDITPLPRVAAATPASGITGAQPVVVALPPPQDVAFSDAPTTRVMMSETPTEPAPPAPVVQQSPSQPAAPPIKVSSLNFDTLVDMYNAIRARRITDPKTINDVARRFEAIANDPEASQRFPFNAERAAHTLFQRARKLEEAPPLAAVPQASSVPPDERPAGDPLAGGG